MVKLSSEYKARCTVPIRSISPTAFAVSSTYLILLLQSFSFT